jgi:hypothetical protein
LNVDPSLPNCVWPEYNSPFERFVFSGLFWRYLLHMLPCSHMQLKFGGPNVGTPDLPQKGEHNFWKPVKNGVPPSFQAILDLLRLDFNYTWLLFDLVLAHKLWWTLIYYTCFSWLRNPTKLIVTYGSIRVLMV